MYQHNYETRGKNSSNAPWGLDKLVLSFFYVSAGPLQEAGTR